MSGKLTLDVAKWKAPKSYLDSEKETVNWLLEPFGKADRDEFVKYTERFDGHNTTKYKGFDTSIMDLADDISNCVHDLEDGIALTVLKMNHLSGICKYFKAESLKPAFVESTSQKLAKRLLSGGKAGQRKDALGGFVNALVNAVQVKIVRRSNGEVFESPLLKYNVILGDEAACALKSIKEIIKDKIVNSDRVRNRDQQGANRIQKLFEDILKGRSKVQDPEFIAQLDRCDSEEKKKRLVCDFIACLTDLDFPSSPRKPVII